MKTLNKIKINNRKLIYNFSDLYKVTKSQTKETIVKNCLKISSLCSYYYSPYNYRTNINVDLETNNIFKFLNSYCYGTCHEIAFFLSYLLKIHGMKTQIIHCDSSKFTHLCLEVYYDNAWHLLDPTLGIFFNLKGNKSILSLKEVKQNLTNKQLLSNKKISLRGLQMDNKNHFFYYKKERVFKNARNKYLNLFKKTQNFNLTDNKFSYKKKFSSQYGLIDFSTFRESNYIDENFSIEESKFSYGIANSKRIKSNKFIKFKNYCF